MVWDGVGGGCGVGWGGEWLWCGMRWEVVVVGEWCGEGGWDGVGELGV